MSGLLITLVLAAGPGTVWGEVRFATPGRVEAVPELFRLPDATFVYEMDPLRDAGRYEVLAVRFPSPIVTPDEANNTVHGEYFRPKGPGRKPAVVVLHILGADFALSRYMAARLADRGVAALFMKLPYYGERRPAGSDKKFLSADIGRSMSAMRQGVCDVRYAAAFLAAQPEVDPGRIGVAGISLGGIVSSLAASVDPTIGRAALLLAGGDLASILWDMPEPEARRYRQVWIESGCTRADLEALTRPVDPLTYAAGLKGKAVLMVAGNVDEVVPPASVKALWEAAGQPELHWLDCGHYSAVGYLLPVVRQTVDFFAGGPGGGGASEAPAPSPAP